MKPTSFLISRGLRTEQRVGHRVQRDIGVRVAVETGRLGQLESDQDERPPAPEPVGVETVADAE